MLELAASIGLKYECYNRGSCAFSSMARLYSIVIEFTSENPYYL